MNCKFISSQSAQKKCLSLQDNNRYTVWISAHTHSWETRWSTLTGFYSCLIRKTDGVSVSSPALSGRWWWHCVRRPACVEKNSEETVDVYAARMEEMCVSCTHCHTSVRAQQEVHSVRTHLKSFLASNLASSTLCVPSFSHFHSFIYIPFLIHSYSSISTSPLFSLFWEWLCTWLSTLHAQPEECKHKSTPIKNKKAAEFTHPTCCNESVCLL